jgi:hypothetical protein
VSLLHVVRAAVKIANDVTKPLHATVAYRQYVSQSGYGKPTYSPPVTSPALSLLAVVELKQKQVTNQQGMLAVSAVTIIFLDVPALQTATNNAGLSVNDSITLADGKSSPILSLGGLIDVGTGIPFATEAYLA